MKWKERKKERKMIYLRSHRGAIGCHSDWRHFRTDEPFNRYPSWQMYWTVSFVDASGWINSLNRTIGGDPQVFSNEIKSSFHLNIIDQLNYFDRMASSLTTIHFLDKLVSNLFRLIHNLRDRKMRLYSDNRNVHHWEIRFLKDLVNHSPPLQQSNTILNSHKKQKWCFCHLRVHFNVANVHWPKKVHSDVVVPFLNENRKQTKSKHWALSSHPA